jgi:hypothetical protein
MRRDDLQQDAMFSYISHAVHAELPSDHPLRPIRRMGTKC